MDIDDLDPLSNCINFQKFVTLGGMARRKVCVCIVIYERGGGGRKHNDDNE